MRPAVVLLAATLAGCGTGPGFHGPDVPYVTTPAAVGAQMLALAGVTARDVVYDLGSGDGRLVIAAARDFGARAVGVEIDGTLVQDSLEAARREAVTDRVTFLWRDLFDVDLRPATVVTLYLLPEINLKLRPKLLAVLTPGARVVSHEFDMGDWPADRVLRVRGPQREHRLLLWVVPARVDGVWTIVVDAPGGPRRYRAHLTQRFQHFAGTITADGVAGRLEDGRLAGDAVTFAVEADGARWEFRGRLQEGIGSGTVQTAGTSGSRPWSARRESGER